MAAFKFFISIASTFFLMLVSLSEINASEIKKCEDGSIVLQILPAAWILDHRVNHYTSSEYDGWVTYQFKLNEKLRPINIKLVDRSKYGKDFEIISKRNLKRMKVIDACKIAMKIDAFIEQYEESNGQRVDFRNNQEHLKGLEFEVTFNYKYDMTYGEKFTSTSELRRFYSDNLFKVYIIEK